MLVKPSAYPGVVLVDPRTLMPRFWASVWASGANVQSLSKSHLTAQLRYVGTFYQACDQRHGHGAFDHAVGAGRTADVQMMVVEYFHSLTTVGAPTTNDARQWTGVKAFVQSLALQLSPLQEGWQDVIRLLDSMGKIRLPNTGRFKFPRALPDSVLVELLKMAEPTNHSNPFEDEGVRLRNWLILNLMLLAGLRRGEVLLLQIDALKHDVSPSTGETLYWLDVTTTEEEDYRANPPSIKTMSSHRQVPVSSELAELWEHYVSEVRVDNSKTAFLVTSLRGEPLSAESVTKMFEKLTASLSSESRRLFSERTGGKRHISPHDLRHTCATARYAMFMERDSNRELTLQRMRAFFGWSASSEMPYLYARAAIKDDLLRSWGSLFDQRVDVLRTLKMESR